MNTPVSVKGEKPATSRGILASLPFDNCSIAAAIGCKLRRGRLGLKIVLILTVLAVGLAAGPSGAGATDVTPFTVSIPAVTGPIASTATPANYAFIANGFGIAPQLPIGYAEEEYFVSGTANIYEWTPTGVEIATPCPIASCTGISYTTRMLVKHPINPEQFSGTVIVEPLNPSAGYDISAVWDRSNAYFVRSHDIFVGFTSKSVAVNAIKTWNPTRYAALNWPYLPFSPGSNNAQLDGMTWDIAAQIGALFKANGPTSPINAFHVQQVFEAGFSQDGSFVFAQINGFHMLELLPGGGTIYDGYVPGARSGLLTSTLV